MATVAEHVPFKDLCSLCEKICKRSGKEKKTPIQDFISRWRDFHVKLHKDNHSSTDSFYSTLRLLLPHCERERAAYGIKELSLAKLFISILCLDSKSSDAQKLLNYRSPKAAKSEAGDFASVAYFILKSRCPDKSSLKIYDINSHLDKISTCNASKDKEGVKSSLLHLLRNTSPIEQKWLIRMILKDMKLGISENSVMKCYHIDAVDVYNVTNSLEKVCIQLKDPNLRQHEIEISLFAPFRPMLGEQAQPTEVEKIMKNQPFVIELKYDGERLQIHKEGNKYMYFSRNGHEVTHVYGSSPLEGKLTPEIANAFKPQVKNCILDGEIVIYSNAMRCIVSKGENADVQALQPDGDYRPCFCIFDILLLNDRVLSNSPLSERVAIIRESICPIPGKIQLTDQKEARTNQDVANALNIAVDNRQEGIVIKDISSTYRPNARKGGGWIKVKPDYIDNLMDELDLVIIGGYFGEGRRGNRISHFLLGLSETLGAQNGKFVSVAKIGSGYTDCELAELLVKLEPNWEIYDRKKNLPHISMGDGHKERPDVWIEPSKSCILQVKAAEIVRSDKFAVNFTLRFPRVQQIRYDKAWNECMTVAEFEEMRNKAGGRLANQYELPAQEEPSPKKARRVAPERKITIAPHFRATNIDDVERVSELFSGKEFCVIATMPLVKQKLEKSIAEHEGTFVQNPGAGTFCVITDRITAKVSNIIQNGKYDVVKDLWLQTCIQQKQLLPWIPSDMFYSKAETDEKFQECFDEFGDSYTEEVSSDDIKKCFSGIPEKTWLLKRLEPRQIADMEFRYFSTSSLSGLFRIFIFYMDNKICIGDPSTEEYNHLSVIAAKIRLHGGTILQDITEDTTHVVVFSKDTDRLEEIKERSRTRGRGRFHIVTETWVTKCIKHKNCLQEKEYMPA